MQHDIERIELRLIADRVVTQDEERRLAAVLQRYLGHPFQIDISYFDAFPVLPGRKFDDFVSMATK